MLRRATTSTLVAGILLAGAIAPARAQDSAPGCGNQPVVRHPSARGGPRGSDQPSAGTRPGRRGPGSCPGHAGGPSVPEGGLPRGRRYYNGRYFGSFNNRFYGPQYGYF